MSFFRPFGLSLLLFFGQKPSASQTDEFQIAFLAWPNTATHGFSDDRTWLEMIKEDYHATAVYLIVPWSFIETGPAKYNFGENKSAGMAFNIQAAIQTILEHDLNLYVRIHMGSLPGDGVLGHPSLPDSLRLDTSDESNDFLRHKTGLARVPGAAKGEKLVNFFSERGRRRLMLVYEHSVQKVYEIAKQAGRLDQLKEINPTLTWHGETEYPWQYFVDYSEPFQISFRQFLKGKYGPDGFQSLVQSWGGGKESPSPQTFDDVNTRQYNWSDVIHKDGTIDPNGYRGLPMEISYDFPGGRIDWMEFRTQSLATLVRDFASINARFAVRCCIQVGSAYDYLIEKRGWFDVTPVVEHSGGIRTANIAGREATFEFESDLMRSVCNFWEHRNERDYVFSSETNWPGYSGLSPEELTEKWSEQLRSFYEAGADAHFISGWGYWGKDAAGLNRHEYVSAYSGEYSAWRDTLARYSRRPVIDRPPSRGVYLPVQRVIETHGYSASTKPGADHCDLFLWLTDSSSVMSVSKAGLYDRTERANILTTYMVELDSSYADRYLDGQFDYRGKIDE